MGAAAVLADRPGMPRRPLLTLAAAAALAFPAGASAMDERDYWAVADRLQPHMDRIWSDGAGYYTGSYSGLNGSMLLTHAVAARRGHDGPARNDRRARRLVDALVSSPPYVATPPPRFRDAQTHAPGFVELDDARRANQHMVIDTEIVDGLRHAWLARRELGLTAAAVGADRRPHPPHHDGQLLPLADDPPEPDQLVRADVRRGRHRDRPSAPAAP